MKNKCEIYGPDLSEHEGQAKQIADEGMKIMRGVGVTGKEAEHTGSDTSKNDLEHLK